MRIHAVTMATTPCDLGFIEVKRFRIISQLFSSIQHNSDGMTLVFRTHSLSQRSKLVRGHQPQPHRVLELTVITYQAWLLIQLDSAQSEKSMSSHMSIVLSGLSMNSTLHLAYYSASRIVFKTILFQLH